MVNEESSIKKLSISQKVGSDLSPSSVSPRSRKARGAVWRIPSGTVRTVSGVTDTVVLHKKSALGGQVGGARRKSPASIGPEWRCLGAKPPRADGEVGVTANWKMPPSPVRLRGPLAQESAWFGLGEHGTVTPYRGYSQVP
ncbi:LOW QUALITY PROTEIN: transporter [Aspergillus luchuensis]|uniref:Transporter n=1 Tax=Aspergillus kawachii TaxID=1069201 RepID=A0A146G0H7_ASPKA|nr:LOW QUALITY PROTEIN: transporter [Aspergillus luchuensis]